MIEIMFGWQYFGSGFLKIGLDCRIFVVVFLAAGIWTSAFLSEDFLSAAFLAEAFLAEDLLAAAFSAAVLGEAGFFDLGWIFVMQALRSI